jgi:hypothetical protein
VFRGAIGHHDELSPWEQVLAAYEKFVIHGNMSSIVNLGCLETEIVRAGHKPDLIGARAAFSRHLGSGNHGEAFCH